MRPELLIFDVNETLLDLRALRPAFERLIGSAEPMGEWFARMLHGSLVANHTNRYRPFGLIGVEALVVVAQKRGIDVDVDEAAAVVAGMRRLPAHPDVVRGLERLAESGFTMVTLTNGAADAASDQLTTAGISGFFRTTFSVDSVRRFKPSPEPYLHVSAMLDVDIDRMFMVAAHDWDIIGARAVGIDGAFLARPGAIWGLADTPPPIVAADLTDLAHQLTP